MRKDGRYFVITHRNGTLPVGGWVPAATNRERFDRRYTRPVISNDILSDEPERDDETRPRSHIVDSLESLLRDEVEI